MGISWYSVIAAFYQEIATPYGLAKTNSEACCVKPIIILFIMLIGFTQHVGITHILPSLSF